MQKDWPLLTMWLIFPYFLETYQYGEQKLWRSSNVLHSSINNLLGEVIRPDISWDAKCITSCGFNFANHRSESVLVDTTPFLQYD